MDESPMSIRILRAIENILNSDDFLEDFTIVPTEDNTKNKSPVLYEHHHLGLESWSVKYVYQYVCSELFKVRPLLAKKKLCYSKMQDLNHLLIGGIFINPDVSTFWNMRRELVENDIVSIETELNFSRLVLTRKSKSLESFSYRRWLLSRVLHKLKLNNVRPPENLLNIEYNVTLAASESSQNNYHSWAHRIWCWENLSPLYVTNELMSSELTFSERWIEKHVSEHSGFHYRQYLINIVKKEKFTSHVFYRYFITITKRLDIINDSDPRHFIQFLLGKKHSKSSLEDLNEIFHYVTILLYDLYVFVEEINKIVPGHESLWYYRRFLLYSLFKVAYEHHGLEFKMCKNAVKFSEKNLSILQQGDNGLKQPKLFKNQLNKVEVSNLYRMLVDLERSFVSCNSIEGKCSAAEIDLASRHTKWLKFVLEVEL